MLTKVVGGWDSKKIDQACQAAEASGLVDKFHIEEARKTAEEVQRAQGMLRRAEQALVRTMRGSEERKIRQTCEDVEATAVNVGGLISEARRQVRELRLQTGTSLKAEQDHNTVKAGDENGGGGHLGCRLRARQQPLSAF